MTHPDTATLSPPAAASAATAAHAGRPGRTWLAASLAAATAALEACGGGGGGGDTSTSTGTAGIATPGTATATPSDAGAAAVAGTQTAGGAAGPLGQSRSFVTPANDADAARFLLQAQFSASDAEIASVRSLGYAGWLARQFDTPGGIGAFDWLVQRGYSDVAVDAVYSTYPADHVLWKELISAPDAVRKRVALALSEIFVVSINGMTTAWPSFMIAAWWDMLSARALGNFRALLEDVTLHPAMGVYLNTRGSLKENAAGRQPDENYAREVMQLMTVGLVRLNPDGTPQSAGAAADTYTQADVTGLARIFTGYDFDNSGSAATGGVPGIGFTRLPMVLNAGNHSTMDASFLGVTVPGSTDGKKARGIALDTLFAHANVGPFIGRQLIQRLVTSNPSPAYVARVAAAFADNGRGTRGDIAATVAAVLLDDEARAPAGLSSATFGRVREPMLRLAQWARTFGLTSVAGSWKLSDMSSANALGQSPLRAASVFNFFRPGYVPPSTAIAAQGLVAPEFQLVSETAVSAYVNFMQSAVRNGFTVRAAASPGASSTGATSVDMAAAYPVERTLVADPAALVARLNLLLAGGQLAPATVALIVQAVAAMPLSATATDAARLDRIAAAVLMVMASPEYLVQK